MDNSIKRVAIFDDDEDILSICTYILEEKGWQVTTFTDCNEIEKKLEQVSPDVILMDNWIPDDGGITATRRIKNVPKLRDIPVIYFSANSDIEILTRQAGADAFLAKPFDLDDLDSTITEVLNH
ncbi:response regulator [Mucilaginibacter sp.]|uniref:response regulator n=1 Tax=Mucilaginibacter sp. TaxID=1882438 RepID=UPI003D13BA80